MRVISVIVFFCALAFCFLNVAAAQSGSERIKVELLVDHRSLQPSASPESPAAKIGLRLEIQPGWHTYWRNSGEAAIPTKVSWRLPQGFRTGELRWPTPESFEEKGGIITYGYREETLLWADLFTEQIIPAPEQKVTLGAKVSWLVCKDICVPGQQEVEIEIPYSTSLSLEPSESHPIFERFEALTPIPLEKVSTDALLSPLVIESLLSVPSQRSELLAVGLHLSGFPKLESKGIDQLITAFPYSESAVIYQQPALKPTGQGVAVRILGKQVANPPDTVKGILVIRKELLGSVQDKAFEWSASTSSAQSEKLRQLLSEDGYERVRIGSHDSKVSANDHKSSTRSTSESGSFLEALLAAFIAGMLLNLMPCVLPIISIKIMGFVSQADQSRGAVLKSSLSFAAGIIFSFLALALCLVSLRAFGFSLGWGFQFQYPQFVAGLLFVVFFLSLALFDFYTVNLPFMQSANEAASRVHSPLARHFFDGILATALSTPCTAPVLGTALVFAFTQPPVFTALIFMTIGVGLALPYVYLSTHPKLLRLLPNPGPWMFHFRQIMGFFLLGTCAWLLFVLHDLTEKGTVWGVVLMLLLFFCLWARKVALESKPERGRSLSFNFIFYGTLGLAAYYFYPAVVAKRGDGAENLITWTEFSDSVLDQAQKSGQAVFIDFTASWCITCKFNEFRIIETQATAEILSRLNILPVKADWTTGDENITAALKRYGAEGVPLYVVLPKSGAEPLVLSTLPTESSLHEALQKAAE